MGALKQGVPMSGLPITTRVRRFLPRYLNEIQAFVIGLLCALFLFFIALKFLSYNPLPNNWENLKKEEKELQQIIKETNKLLDDLSKTVKKNRKLVN